MSTNMFSRKLLVSSPSSIWQHSDLKLTAEPPLPKSITHMNINLDKNILFIISIIMCGVIISFIMNFIIKYALKCLSSTASEAIASSSAPSASQGIKQEALEAFPVVTYSAEAKLPGQDTECVICLSEFVSGDKVRVLPKCSHGFHVVCIDQWLGSHSTCPKCRHCLINICEKIVEGSGQAAGSPEPFLPAQGIPPSCILPLEHETMVRIYRSSS